MLQRCSKVSLCDDSQSHSTGFNYTINLINHIHFCCNFFLQGFDLNVSLPFRETSSLINHKHLVLDKQKVVYFLFKSCKVNAREVTKNDGLRGESKDDDGLGC